jgi:uncharacterized membrane protein
MIQDLSSFGLLTTFALAVAAVWIALNRYRIRLDSNWPVVFYLAMLVHAGSYPFMVNAWLLYAAVICGMLLRFEFLGRRSVEIIRAGEVGALALISWQMFHLLWREYA